MEVNSKIMTAFAVFLILIGTGIGHYATLIDESPRMQALEDANHELALLKGRYEPIAPDYSQSSIDCNEWVDQIVSLPSVRVPSNLENVDWIKIEAEMKARNPQYRGAQPIEERTKVLSIFELTYCKEWRETI